ncbi:virulence factor SrfB [Methylobacterium sp. SI9]|uniref:virulence factor SrfB n=1 Tax=Methylobacterium guangdongense TaxID=3138811 RepID=UPI00313B68B2
MFAKLIDPSSAAVRLTPYSGVQFLTYALRAEEAGRMSRRFIERPVDSAPLVNGKIPYQLIPAWDENDPRNGIEVSARPSDKEYTVSERAALEIFMEKWVPVPMLRVKIDPDGRAEFDLGPTNWARARIVEIVDRAPDDPVSHYVTFAIDTELRDRRTNRPYTSPSPDDAEAEHEFRFAHKYRDIAWYLGAALGGEDGEALAQFQKWVPAWLLEMFREFKQAQRPGRPLRENEDDPVLEHIARYLVFLEYLSQTIEPRVVRMLDTVSDAPVIQPIAVDLILDVGNSRTCGICIESRPNDNRVDLNNSFVMHLRDLSEPERVYSDPFESHVELAQARFGRDHLSVHSGVSRAFFWPSPVRVGPEAARFRQSAHGNEVVTGLSSPKRYLCDTGALQQEWRFAERDYDPYDTGRKSSPLIDKAIRQFVNSRGDVIEQLEYDRRRYNLKVRSDDRVGAQHLSFSRSSFFTFMVAEIIWQAIVMINDAAVREDRAPRDAPRRLRRIILTLPPAMPVQEQRLLRSRAEGAVKLIWKLMGWWEKPPRGVFPPVVHVAWDEASCVQLVYLYGEITQKLGGSIRGFMDLIGRPRCFAEPEKSPAPEAVEERSVRIASIDIGGGTSDLMITTYYQEANTLLRPVQNFREGFRIAGDDLLKQVIERLVLPAIEGHLRDAGMEDPRRLFNELFGGDRANMSELEKHKRRQFVRRVLEPIGLAMLGDAAEHSMTEEQASTQRSFADFFPTPMGRKKESGMPAKALLDFIEAPAHAAGAANFRLADCVFVSDSKVIRQAVNAVLGDVFDNLCELIHEFDPDVVLLTGRPSRLPAVIDLLANRLAVTPDRVVPMHLYQAGNWYPFRDRDTRRIGDPKTTTVVGAMLCALAENQQLTNFALETGRMGLRSTAKYIGKLDGNNRIESGDVYFDDVDLDAKGAAGQEAKFRYYARMRIGYRQLPLERWIATPLYRLRLHAGIDNAQFRTPITVTIQRREGDRPDEDQPDALIQTESMKEDFEIADAMDLSGKDAKPKMDFSLDTMDREQGYWLDTGVLGLG